jgi:hypothetical protein
VSFVVLVFRIGRLHFSVLDAVTNDSHQQYVAKGLKSPVQPKLVAENVMTMMIFLCNYVTT